MATTKQRKLRTKLSFDADDEADGDTGVPPPPPPPASGGAGAAKAKASSGSSKKAADLLSFGDDEETALLLSSSSSSKSKKKKSSSSSARVSKFARAGVDPAAAGAAGPTAAGAGAANAGAGHRPTAGEYTAERLAALHASTAKLPDKYKPPPSAALSAAPAAAPAGGGDFKLSGSFKAAKKPNDDRFTYNYSITGTIGTGAAAGAAAGAANGQQQPQQQHAMPLPPPPKRPGAGGATAPATAQPSAAAAAGGGGGSDSGGGDDDDDFMPDEETIKLAKAKRERLRQAQLAPDYLPLGGTSKLLGVAAAAAAGGGGNAAAGYGSDSEGEQEQEQHGGGLTGLQEQQGQQGGLGGGGSDSEAELEERMRLTFVGGSSGGQQRQRGAARAGAGSAASRAAAAAARASGQYAMTVQDGEDAMDEDHADPLQQRLAAAARRNAAGGDGAGRLAGSGAAAAAGAGVGVSGARGEAAVAAAAAGVLDALEEAAARAAGRHKQVTANLKRTDDNLVGALDEADRIRADIAATGAKYAAVQAFRAYLNDLAECLAAKGPLVEELCDTLEGLRVDAAAAVRQQQQDDESILFAQAEAAVTAALGILGRGGDAAAAAAAAQAAAADAEPAAVAAAAAGGSSSSEPELDEFGRDVSLMRRKELERGAGRRQRLVGRLLAELQALQQGGVLNLDADLPPPLPDAAAAAGSTAAGSTAAGSTAAAAVGGEAVQQYSRRRREALELAPTVFADADEAYASLTAVKGRLEGFKAQYPREYGQAYVGESAAALFAPYVRLQLLQWEPLPLGGAGDPQQQQQDQQPPAAAAAEAANGAPAQQLPAGFDTQDWYQQLFEYGLAPGADGDAAAAAAAAGGGDDADANLVPQLVESLILPMALTLVDKCWNPCDLPQSRSLVSLVSDLFVYVPADKPEMSALLAATSAALEAAAASPRAAVPPWPSAAAGASPLARAVLQLRFRRAAGLLQGLLGFKELVPQHQVFRLALGRLVGQQLVPALRGSLGDLGLAVARAEAVVAALPGGWFGGGGGRVPPQRAQPLLDVVASLGRSVEQQAAAGGGGGGSSSYAARVAALLRHLGLSEQAARLAALGR